MKLLTETMENPNSKDALRELANLLQMQRDSAWNAIRQAIPCLDTDKDLADHYVKHCHPDIAARRAALRRCESVLDSQNAATHAPGANEKPLK
jgi:hypothetical protein